MVLKEIVPDIGKLTPVLFFNLIISKVWKNMGYMENIKMSRKGKEIKIKTRKELNVKNIGLNNLSIGTYIGTLNILYGSQVKFIDAKNRDGNCDYIFSLTEKPFLIETRNKKEYEKLNRIPEIKSFTLKDALRTRLFEIKGNKLYFRGKGIGIIENTLFHLLGNAGILLEKVPEISFNFFRETIKDSGEREKLVLLKTLLQTLGWGLVTISHEKNTVKVEIKNPPHGFQKTGDNWIFLSQAIMGYLWTINRNFRLDKEEVKNKKLELKYSF